MIVETIGGECKVLSITATDTASRKPTKTRPVNAAGTLGVWDFNAGDKFGARILQNNVRAQFYVNADGATATANLWAWFPMADTNFPAKVQWEPTLLYTVALTGSTLVTTDVGTPLTTADLVVDTITRTYGPTEGQGLIISSPANNLPAFVASDFMGAAILDWQIAFGTATACKIVAKTY